MTIHLEESRVLVTGGSGFRAKSPFEQGLRETVEWYQKALERVPEVTL